MKKVLLLASVAVLVLSSCKKDRDCVCKNDNFEDTTVKFEKSSKKDAEDACDILDSNDGSSCELK